MVISASTEPRRHTETALEAQHVDVSLACGIDGMTYKSTYWIALNALELEFGAIGRS